MTLDAIPGNNGLVSVTLSARADAPSIRAARRRSYAKRGKITQFSRKSRARFRQQLATAAIPWTRSAVVTLNFPGLGPKAAKQEYAAFIRLAKKRLPGAFGWHSVEFKAGGLLHLHVLLCAPSHPITAIMALREEFAAKFPSVAYMRPMISLRGWLAYIAKHDAQRNIPAQFAGHMTKFWGAFGKLPKLPGARVTLPEGSQAHVRQAVAALVAEQGGERSHGFAQAVAASSGKITVWLSPAQSARFVNPLVVVFSRQRQGTQSPRIDARNTRATPPAKSRPRAHSPQRKAPVENKFSEVKPHFLTKRTRGPCNPPRYSL